jgi:hypothetical protein
MCLFLPFSAAAKCGNELLIGPFTHLEVIRLALFHSNPVPLGISVDQKHILRCVDGVYPEHAAGYNQSSFTLRFHAAAISILVITGLVAINAPPHCLHFIVQVVPKNAASPPQNGHGFSSAILLALLYTRLKPFFDLHRAGAAKLNIR